MTFRQPCLKRHLDGFPQAWISFSRPLYAGRRLPSNPISGKLVPEDGNARGFDDKSLDYDA
ncbi:hypothetical protein LMG29542_06771 [Paraburkholderia humisilvae]|uniref:Uncharacterized protein n=2 Tax=Paraburkholderia humisilvae TaxID=627669 RepID=A0A6J5F0U3_9BURK|nr:hypothetical protein LMG29542_06771 [Paraburkholderia humisilvae]